MKTKLPATVSVLTRNSGATLAQALRSVQAFDDVLVLDAGSTDDTLSIAHTYKARVLPQDPEALDTEGRLKDWSVVRNQALVAGKHAWHLYIDSDEVASQMLIDEIRQKVTHDVPGAFWVPRKYVFNGIIVERSLGYPNRQMRFFHRDAVTGFRKPIHERLEMKSGAATGTLSAPLYVPVDRDLVAARAKMKRYIALEIARHKPLTRPARIRMVLGAAKACVRTVLRLVRMLFERGPRLPIRYDCLGLEYEIRVALAALFGTRV